MNPSNPNEPTVTPDDKPDSTNDFRNATPDQQPTIIAPETGNQTSRDDEVVSNSSTITPNSEPHGQNLSSDTTQSTAEPSADVSSQDAAVTSTTPNNNFSDTSSETTNLAVDSNTNTNQTTDQGSGLAAAAPVVQSSKKPKKKLFVAIAIILVGLLLLAGGVAGAYYGYVLPNKPENILKNATLQTLSSDQLTFDGKAELSGDDIGAAKTSFVSQMDNKNGSSNTTVNVVFSGVDVSFDARIVDENLYLKAGDLTTVKSLLLTYAGFSGDAESNAQLTALIDQAADLLSDQWVLFDSTLLDQASSECDILFQTAFTETDLVLLEEQFSKNPFVTINNSSDETVDDIATKKFDLTIDHKKGEAYARSLSELSFVKELAKCEEAATEYDEEITTDSLFKNESTNLSVWVDTENNRLHKIGLNSLALQPEGDQEYVVSAETRMKYDTFTVETPQDVKPALQVFAELQQLFFNAQSVLGDSTLISNVTNTLREQ